MICINLKHRRPWRRKLGRASFSLSSPSSRQPSRHSAPRAARRKVKIVDWKSTATVQEVNTNQRCSPLHLVLPETVAIEPETNAEISQNTFIYRPFKDLPFSFCGYFAAITDGDLVHLLIFFKLLLVFNELKSLRIVACDVSIEHAYSNTSVCQNSIYLLLNLV